MNIENLTAALLKLKAHKKKCDDEFKAAMARTAEGIEMLEARILTTLEEQGGSSMKTKYGTVFRKTLWSTTVEDPGAFRDYLEEHGYEAADIRANKTYIREMVEKDGKEPPPGVKITLMNTLNINTSTRIK